MISEIKILNRFYMDRLLETGGLDFPYDSWHLISIYGDDKPYVTESSLRILKQFGLKDFLSLEFWDITPAKHANIQNRYPEAIFFDEKHAKKIIDFIDKIQKQKKESALVVHCSAGISRSGAVGTFVCDYLQMDYGEFLKHNNRIMANPYVLRVLRNVAELTPDFGSHDGVAPIDKKGLIF